MALYRQGRRCNVLAVSRFPAGAAVIVTQVMSSGSRKWLEEMVQLCFRSIMIVSVRWVTVRFNRLPRPLQASRCPWNARATSWEPCLENFVTFHQPLSCTVNRQLMHQLLFHWMTTICKSHSAFIDLSLHDEYLCRPYLKKLWWSTYAKPNAIIWSFYSFTSLLFISLTLQKADECEDTGLTYLDDQLAAASVNVCATLHHPHASHHLMPPYNTIKFRHIFNVEDNFILYW